jgi:hypothetical protein
MYEVSKHDIGAHAHGILQVLVPRTRRARPNCSAGLELERTKARAATGH